MIMKYLNDNFKIELRRNYDIRKIERIKEKSKFNSIRYSQKIGDNPLER